ncbi:hypothetical protein FOMG_08863 [Fusarium oxysporum f. sp. melonis 26406]|uniref:Uncharacterized protein n=1 Tax=Fusarium oxysporum f. sp. melonis 26406 TaxID=1089452 RepID=W9ZUY1_FUSOX|nr:hypothetical protein FOMG_08863 [Fusarium oxysporum f. sp. melonis 26406]
MSDRSPYGKYENWTECQKLDPYVGHSQGVKDVLIYWVAPV